MIRTAALAAAAMVTCALAPTPAAYADSTCPTPPALPARFVPHVDNPYFPLVPGTTFVYHGKLDGEPAVDRFTITSGTKSILGVRTTVVRDRTYVKGSLVEDTFDWYAQDAAGNVWYFGEDTRELDHGTVTSTEGSWQAGVDGAKPGIFMPANPSVGSRFKQEHAPGVAEDCVRIADRAAQVKTPYVRTEQALRTDEFSLLEPGVLDNKYYVRGIGLVREQTVVGGDEVLSLVTVRSPNR